MRKPLGNFGLITDLVILLLLLLFVTKEQFKKTTELLAKKRLHLLYCYKTELNNLTKGTSILNYYSPMVKLSLAYIQEYYVSLRNLIEYRPPAYLDQLLYDFESIVVNLKSNTARFDEKIDIVDFFYELLQHLRKHPLIFLLPKYLEEENNYIWCNLFLPPLALMEKFYFSFTAWSYAANYKQIFEMFLNEDNDIVALAHIILIESLLLYPQMSDSYKSYNSKMPPKSLQAIKDKHSIGRFLYLGSKQHSYKNNFIVNYFLYYRAFLEIMKSENEQNCPVNQRLLEVLHYKEQRAIKQYSIDRKIFELLLKGSAIGYEKYFSLIISKYKDCDGKDMCYFLTNYNKKEKRLAAKLEKLNKEQVYLHKKPYLTKFDLKHLEQQNKVDIKTLLKNQRKELRVLIKQQKSLLLSLRKKLIKK